MKAVYDDQGLLLVVSGPSGVGKGTVCSRLRKRMPRLGYSISVTTRAPRKGEQDGVNYFFRSHQQFQNMIRDEKLIEWAEYVGNYYGTPRHFVQDTLATGQDVLLEIEVQGAKQVKKTFPQGIFIFLLPPSMKDLQYRILNRGTETERTIQERLHVARDELQQMEMYDYVVINDQVDRACERIQSIITAEHCRTSRIRTEE